MSRARRQLLNDLQDWPARPVGSEPHELARERLLVELEGFPGTDIREIGIVCPPSPLGRNLFILVWTFLALALWSWWPFAAAIALLISLYWCLAVMRAWPTGIDFLGIGVREVVVLAGPNGPPPHDDGRSETKPRLIIAATDSPPATLLSRPHMPWPQGLVRASAFSLTGLLWLALVATEGAFWIRLLAATFAICFFIVATYDYARFGFRAARPAQNAALADVCAAASDRWQQTEEGAAAPLVVGLSCADACNFAGLKLLLRVFRRYYGASCQICYFAPDDTLKPPLRGTAWYARLDRLFHPQCMRDALSHRFHMRPVTLANLLKEDGK